MTIGLKCARVSFSGATQVQQRGDVKGSGDVEGSVCSDWATGKRCARVIRLHGRQRQIPRLLGCMRWHSIFVAIRTDPHRCCNDCFCFDVLVHACLVTFVCRCLSCTVSLRPTCCGV
jgi:hypothetical protein